ncbi:MAG: Do family serine endopeptidase [Bacteroidetes bacterium]|nr:Do family serine endopeptidase [Bacteroidota bacterium]
MKHLATIFFIALIGGATALTVDHYLVRNESSIQANVPNNYPVKFTGFNGMVPEESSADFIKASEISLPAVVHVKTEYAPQRNQLYFYDPFHMWGQVQPNTQPQVGSGSGVIISGDGYIVTNNHVIKGADKVEVILYDKRTYTAKVIGKDPSTDIALLKIEEKNLPYLLYANSDDVKVGEWVLAVGNPFNLTSTVTAGIVSAKARNINILEDDQSRDMNPVESYIQTDAAVNPGNSGGALVNTSGQLIGINSAIASNTGSYTGYSFAVPVNLAKKVVNDLIEFGKVQRAFLGVSIRDLDSKLIEEKKLADTKGVYVTGVSQSGSANEAGIEEGDIIMKVGEVAVNNVPELQEQIGHYRPGDKLAVVVKRNGAEKTFPVTLRSKTGDTMISKVNDNEVLSLLGANFESLSSSDMKRLGIDGGVKITSLEAGKLRSAGIKEGFIITSIDKKKVDSLDDVKSALENKEGGVLIEGVYTNGMKAYYALGL